MKKVLFLFFMFLTVFAVVACNGVTTEAPTTEAPTTEAPTTVAPTTEAPTTEEADTEAPVITGVDDITVYLDTVFDPLAGVAATDNKDGDLTDQIVITGVVDTTKEGTNFLKYSVTDNAGNKKEETRYVFVEIDPSLIGDEIIQNGDFALGNAIWNVTDGEGSTSNFTVVDEVGVLEVVAASWNPWAPRLESNVIEFENGVTYEITFDAKADAIRAINVQVGELLPSAPWFDDYKPLQPQVFDLSTDWQTFTFKFTMNKETGPGQLLFENGTVAGTVGTANLVTTVYYDNVVIVESTPDADTQAPVITGATDLTLETGAVYDPLAGVSAYDVVDGEITLDSTHYVSNVDTDVPGEYEVTYTVTDVAGNTATITIYVTVVNLVFTNTNDITDGTFTTTTEIVPEVQDEFAGWADITDPEIWYNYVAGWDGAAATFTVVDGAAVIEVTAPGNNDWGVMLKQNGLTLVTGETYKLTFTASSNVARDLTAKVSDFYFATFNLGTEATTYSFIFTYEENSSTTERVLFLLGSTPAYAASTVTIDNVELGILEQDQLLFNGDFSEIGWGTWSHDGASTIGIVNGELVVNVASVGTDPYSVQLFQNDIPLVEGSTYEITFDAKADVAREIIYKIMTPGYNVRTQQTVALTTEYQTFTYSFVYDGTDPLGQINFELGNISGATAGTVYFDNVAMTKDSEAINVKNGNFEQVLNWGTWSHDGASTIGIVNGELVVDVASVGTDPYSVQLFQNDIALVQGNLYTIVFSAKADVAREIIYKIMTPGYNVRTQQTVALTTEYQTFTYSFVYDGTDPLGQINFELGNISGATAGTVYFDNVYFYRSFNPQEEPVVPTEEVWTAYGTMTVEETETEKTLTYVAGDSAWWDSNLQGLLPAFDGTNNAIVFTVTGTAGHEYLFKFEGGGQFKEIVFIASGVQEEITLDLSALTEAQRSALNLIVIFNHNTTQAGTLILHDWAYGNVVPAPTQLLTPFGIVTNATSIVWGAIPEASSFEVYITAVAGSPFTTAAGMYSFDFSTLGLAAGTYDFTIKAIGDGVNYLDSEMTTVFQFTVAP